jgi:hypothetical protein
LSLPAKADRQTPPRRQLPLAKAVEVVALGSVLRGLYSLTIFRLAVM